MKIFKKTKIRIKLSLLVSQSDTEVAQSSTEKNLSASLRLLYGSLCN
jgi:hypothetical protein